MSYRIYISLSILLIFIHSLSAGDLYILSVGIEPTLLQKGKFDLYSEDAEHIAKALESSKSLYKKSHTRLLNGKNATRNEVLKSLKWLKSETQEKDTAIIFFSSHGQIEKKNGYYFTLAPDNKKHKESWLYATEFNTSLKDIKANIIIFADTCEADGLIPKKVNNKISYFVASKAKESSYGQEKETRRPHGYFVIALCEALDGFADLDGNKTITLAEVKSYIADRTFFFCDEQTAVARISIEHQKTKLSKVKSKGHLKLALGSINTKNPYGVIDIENAFNKETLTFLKSNKQKINKKDPNKETWHTLITQSKLKTIDGAWQSRWKEGSKKWFNGNAWVTSTKDRTYLIYNGANNDYLMELKKIARNKIGGRYMNLDDSSDTGPWVGYIVSPERIDGFFPSGRWDLRRTINNK